MTSTRRDLRTEARALVARDMDDGSLETLGVGTRFNGGGVAAGQGLLTSTKGDALQLWTVK